MDVYLQASNNGLRGVVQLLSGVDARCSPIDPFRSIIFATPLMRIPITRPDAVGRDRRASYDLCEKCIHPCMTLRL